MKIRGFEIVSNTNFETILLPKRSTKNSAGYDFFLNEDVLIKSGENVKIFTDIKAYMQDDEYLEIHIRSSLGIKGLFMLNTVGIIDSDYYNNSSNEGNIIVNIKNTSKEDIILKTGDRIVQGIFKKYLITDDDQTIKSRTGGFGSTN